MTSISIAAKASRDIKSHVATLEADHGPAGAHAACALVKLAYAGPHHRAKMVGVGAVKPLVQLLRDGAAAGGGPGFSAVDAACKIVGVLAYDGSAIARVLVTAGVAQPLVALLSTDAAAAAALAIQTLLTKAGPLAAFSKAHAPLRRLLLDGASDDRARYAAGSALSALDEGLGREAARLLRIVTPS